jgi:hypothetical protein
MADPQESKKRKFLGLHLPERSKSPSRRQPSPQPPTGRSPSKTSATRLKQSSQPNKPDEPASKLSGRVQNAEFKRRLDPLRTAEPRLKSIPLVLNSASSSGPQSSDRQQTKTRYVEAYNSLRKAIETDKSLRAVFDELSVDPEGVDDSTFMDALNRALESQNSKVKDRSAWGTCKSIVKYLVHTFKPFAKNFLMIAREGSSVFSIRAFSDIHRFRS